MADHYYSCTIGNAGAMDRGTVVVDTSTTAGSVMELRVTDGGVTRQQLVLFLDKLEDFLASNDGTVFVPGTLLAG